MKRKRFTEEQIIAVLPEHEAEAKTADLARKHGISEATLHNGKAKYGGIDVSEANRLRSLEGEPQGSATNSVPTRSDYALSDGSSSGAPSGAAVADVYLCFQPADYSAFEPKASAESSPARTQEQH
jgi:putative transposase